MLNWSSYWWFVTNDEKMVHPSREEEAKKSKILNERFSDKKSLASRGASAVVEVLEKNHQNNITDEQVSPSDVNHHSNIKTMKDVIEFVLNNLVTFYHLRKDDASYELASKFLKIESSSSMKMERVFLHLHYWC